jgi:hypothetical protein
MAITIFMAAVLIFIGFFSQSLQTAVEYQEHNTLATKASDLLDTILLNPGLPLNWGKTDSAIVCFGLQDPEFSQYKVSTFSLMRLSSNLPLVEYPRTATQYSNQTAGFGSCLLTPNAETLNYSQASKMLGINATYGFQLTLTPTVNVEIQKTSTGTPLTFEVYVEGTGFPVANSAITYSLILVNQSASQYPTYAIFSDTKTTDGIGQAELTFPGVDGENNAYALIVYSYLYGLKGMGYYVHDSPTATKSVVPLVDSFTNQRLLLVHSDSLGTPPSEVSQLNFNASFVILTEEYTLRPVGLDEATSVGTLTFGGGGQDYASLTIPDNNGILIVTYQATSGGQYGIVLMPWGLGSLAYPVTFGINPLGQDWVTTDIRQVTVGGIAYQAKLALWSLKVHQVMGQ